MSERVILHADMDAFFASVEQRDAPELRGLPVAVGGRPPRGVIAAASYEARVFGVHSAQPTARALRLCPDLVLRAPRFSVYQQVSAQVMEVFRSFSPRVEPLSLDEAFLDLTGTRKLHGPPEQVAHRLKARVREVTSLVVSVGVGPSKFIAKLASDLGKPDGLLVVRPEGVRALLDPLPVSRLFGAGKVTQRKLHDLGIQTIGQLAATSPETLTRRLGSLGEQLRRLAVGDDPRDLEVDRAAESVGHEETFPKDISDLEALAVYLRAHADEVAARLRAGQVQARVVMLKVKTHDFKLCTRRRTLPRATSDALTLARVADELLGKLWRARGPMKVRLIGLSAGGLVPEQGPRQLSFDEPERARELTLGRTLDLIHERFGQAALKRAETLDEEE